VVSIVKPNYSGIIDQINPHVTLARGNQGPLYNPLYQSYDDYPDTPTNTLWNSDGWGDLLDVKSRAYTTFVDSLGHNVGNNIIGAELIMFDQWNDKYYKFSFSQWTQGGHGGGFAYTRQEIIPPGNGNNYTRQITIRNSDTRAELGTITLSGFQEVFIRKGPKDQIESYGNGVRCTSVGFF
jgi:hypothetical protein